VLNLAVTRTIPARCRPLRVVSGAVDKEGPGVADLWLPFEGGRRAASPDTLTLD